MYSLVAENKQVLNKKVLCFKITNDELWDLDRYV